jgi:WD40 repeat protein
VAQPRGEFRPADWGIAMNLDAKQLLARYQPKPGKELKPDQQVCVARFSHCGKFLAAGDYSGTVRRWDVTADPPAELPRLTGHGGFVQGLVFHPDGKRLFTADSWGRLRCWPYAEKDPKPLWDIAAAHDGWIRGLAPSPDGQRLATCGRDRMVRMWDAASGKKIAETAGHQEDVFAVAFHPSGQTLVSADLRGIVKQWDITKPNLPQVRQIEVPNLYKLDRLQDVPGVRCLVFDKDADTLAVAGGVPKNGGFTIATPVVLLYDWASGKLKQMLKLGTDNDGWVEDLLWHADGFLMGVISGQPGAGKVFFQKPEDAQPFFVKPTANPHSLALHPDGRRMVVAATNANSAGNGRQVNGSKEYPANWSPLQLFEFPKV